MSTSLLDRLETAITALDELTVELMSGAELGGVVVELDRLQTALTVRQARFVHAAERAGVWKATGATSMPAWLADATHSTYGSAKGQVVLADTLAAVPLLADKMAGGDPRVTRRGLRHWQAAIDADTESDRYAALVDVQSGHRGYGAGQRVVDR